MVRLSPAEREDLAAKAALVGESLSGGMRAALAAWQPGCSTGNAIRNEPPEKLDTVRVVYDE